MKIRNSLIAGLCGTSVHSLLALVHGKTGPLSEFQPNSDILMGLSWLIGTEIHPGLAWLLWFVNGAVIWGFVFGQVYSSLPGKNPLAEGFFLCHLRPHRAMGFVLFLLVDRGVFAVRLGLGISPRNFLACDVVRLQRDDESCLSSAGILVGS